MKRRIFLLGSAALLAQPLTAAPQHVGRTKTAGFLYPWGPPPPPPHLAELDRRITTAMQEELRNHGWAEGKNLTIERRFARGRVDALPALAAELVALNVDVIYTPTGTGALAAKRATSTIPIVTISGDMVAQGLVSNLARPDSNVTGQNMMHAELAGKRLHLLRELLPRASRVAVLGCGPGKDMGLSWPSTEAAARALRLQLLQYTPQTQGEVEAAIQDATKAAADGLLLLDCPRFNSWTDKTMFLRHTLPGIYYFGTYADAGGLMAYGPDDVAMFRRAAWYIGRILNGATPADLPIEQPTEFRLVINRKTAKALGLTVPQSLLLRANDVIE